MVLHEVRGGDERAELPLLAKGQLRGSRSRNLSSTESSDKQLEMQKLSHILYGMEAALSCAPKVT